MGRKVKLVWLSYLFWDRVSFFSPGWTWTQDNFPASAFHEQLCVTTAPSCKSEQHLKRVLKLEVSHGPPAHSSAYALKGIEMGMLRGCLHAYIRDSVVHSTQGKRQPIH